VRQASTTAALGVILFACASGEPTGPALSYLSLFPDRRVAVVGEHILLKVTARDLAGTDLPNFVPKYTSSSSSVVRIDPNSYYQPKLSLDWTTVDIYAPASGTVMGIAPDGAIGSRIRIRPRDLPVLDIQIFHVSIDSGVVRYRWVDAGEHIGRHASSATMSDIAMSIGPKEGGTLISYFDAMTDAVFAQYQARGVPSREAAIITEAERDADPAPCVGEQQFTVHGTLPDWLVLN